MNILHLSSHYNLSFQFEINVFSNRHYFPFSQRYLNLQNCKYSSNMQVASQDSHHIFYKYINDRPTGNNKFNQDVLSLTDTNILRLGNACCWFFFLSIKRFHKFTYKVTV